MKTAKHSPKKTDLGFMLFIGLILFSLVAIVVVGQIQARSSSRSQAFAFSRTEKILPR